jgi:hypothetical protein
MSTRTDKLMTELFDVKGTVFLVFFLVPFILIGTTWTLGLWFCFTNGGTIPAPLDRFPQAPGLASFLIGFAMGILAGFSSWFVIVFRKNRLLIFSYCLGLLCVPILIYLLGQW